VRKNAMETFGMLKGAFRAIETQVVTWFSEFRSGVISVEA
jgi:hypothetical protein